MKGLRSLDHSWKIHAFFSTKRTFKLRSDITKMFDPNLQCGDEEAFFVDGAHVDEDEFHCASQRCDCVHMQWMEVSGL